MGLFKSCPKCTALIFPRIALSASAAYPIIHIISQSPWTDLAWGWPETFWNYMWIWYVVAYASVLNFKALLMLMTPRSLTLFLIIETLIFRCVGNQTQGLGHATIELCSWPWRSNLTASKACLLEVPPVQYFLHHSLWALPNAMMK